MERHPPAAGVTPSLAAYSQHGQGQPHAQGGASHGQPTQYVQIGETYYQVIDPAAHHHTESSARGYQSQVAHHNSYEHSSSSRHGADKAHSSTSHRGDVPAQIRSRLSAPQQAHDSDIRRPGVVGENIVARVFNAPLASIPMVTRDPQLLELNHQALTDVFNAHSARLFEKHQKHAPSHSAPPQPSQPVYSQPARRGPPLSTVTSKPAMEHSRLREHHPPQPMQAMHAPAPPVHAPPPAAAAPRSQHHRGEQVKVLPPPADRDRPGTKHLCVSCRKPAQMVCSICQRVWYCGRDCQVSTCQTLQKSCLQTGPFCFSPHKWTCGYL